MDRIKQLEKNIENLKKKLEAEKQKKVLNIAKLAYKAKLIQLSISDDQLLKEFELIYKKYEHQTHRAENNPA